MTIIPVETVEQRVKRLSRALIGVQSAPAGFEFMRAKAIEAFAYHKLQPYPWFHFQDWKSEDRGPLPRCMPFVSSIVRKGAKWLFGKPIQITVPENEELEKFFRSMWMKNRMGTRLVAAAEKAAYQGGFLLKWSYDETDSVPLRFQILSTIDECRLFFDPQDKDRLLMLRVQYPFYDEATKKFFWYREEWTDESEVHYEPLEDAKLASPGSMTDPYGPYTIKGLDPDKATWTKSFERENPFEVIPAQPVRNIETDHSLGAGDFWDLFRVVDRVNLTYHLMDKSNQFDSEPNKIFIDLMAETDDIDALKTPGSNISLETKQTGQDGEEVKKQGQVVMLEPKGNLRPAMMEYARELQMMLNERVGSVEIRPDEVTNKGNLTQAVLTQLYLPLIEATDEKRKTYGEDGISKLLEKCAIGLKNLKVKEAGAVDPENEETHNVQLTWSPYFQPTAEEKSMTVATTQLEVNAGYITQEIAIERVASMEGIEDVKGLKDELEEKAQRLEDADKAATEALIKAAATAGEQPGPNE